MKPNFYSAVVALGLIIGTSGQTFAAGAPLPPPIPLLDIDLSKVIDRVALGSCFAPQLDGKIWQSVQATKPDLFLFLGDNVYSSDEQPDADLPFLKEAYQLLGEVPSFSALRAQVPMMVTWDDHDYGMNDAGASWMARAEAEALHEHVWAQSESDPRRTRDGVYYSNIVGPKHQQVQVIMLDTRFFRSDLKPASDRDRYGKFEPSNDPEKTMLGKDQWDWLADQLEKEADLRLIVSSVAVVADQHNMEGWRTLPLERTKLFNLIASTGANGVVFLSGDRHFSGFYSQNDNVPYPLLEFMSSSMNLPITGKTADRYRDEDEPRKITPSVMEANFGTLDIDWQQRSVVFSIRGSSGKVVVSHQIKLDELRPK